jgi:HAD superfamily hydrolase (TIGR01509 family)
VRFDWLFFDLGNTLVDESAAQRDRCLRAVSAMARLGTVITPHELESHVHSAGVAMPPSPYAAAMRAILKDEDAVRAVLREAPYSHDHERLYPEVLETLALLATQYRIGVIANQSPGAAGRIAAFGLGTYVSVCVASAEAKLSKPDPAIFRLALQQAGATAERSAMIGDRPENDIRPAKELGFATIGVFRGPRRPPPASSPLFEPNAVVTDLAELPSVLARLESVG